VLRIVSSTLRRGCDVLSGPLLGSGILVEDPQDLPDFPDDTVRPGRSCHVVVRLERVYYTGDDIGSDWRLTATVDGGFWDSGPIAFHHNSVVSPGAVVLDRLRPGSCGIAQLLSLLVHARERDWLFDDVGHLLQPLILRCSELANARHLIVAVPVAESPTTWFQRRKIAILYFHFSIRTQCA
jgi:hypothetical protein